MHETNPSRLPTIVTSKIPTARAPSAQCLQPSPDVLWQRLDDEVIVMQLKTDLIFSLNPTGARFWELIAGGMKLEAVHEEMGKEFDVPPEVLATEVEGILALMIREQLLISRES
jgi:Coenzyme PQQ synthesis protein D (PqqD)